MNCTILDEIRENSSNCYLVKVRLKDFVCSLSEGFKDYEVQREIVNNTYLDNLIDTVLNQKHIPPIILVVDNDNLEKEGNDLNIKEFKILDGLQRTYRLKLIWDTIELFNQELESSKEILKFTRIQLSRIYSQRLTEVNSNSKILESIVNYYKEKTTNGELVKIEDCYNNFQWFEVWSNLKPSEEVSKMLVLNAGHKPVKAQHQLELLFLNLIPIIKKTNLSSFTLVREKESNSTIFSKNRKEGQFHFSHIITSILSLNEGKPITTNVNLINKAQSTDFEVEQFDKYFNYEFLYRFTETLLKLDSVLTTTYPEAGSKWMGREVALVGMFAALGKYGNSIHITPIELLNVLETKIIKNPTCLNLNEFDKARNNLNLSKINIGTVNKNAVYKGIYDILEENQENIIWENYFKGQA